MSEKSKGSTKQKKRREGSGIDWLLVLIVVILLVFGLIMLYSASSYNSQLKFGSSSWYVRRQLIATGLGIVLMFGVAFIPLKVWKKASFFLYIAGVASVILVLTPIGEEYLGARRWLNLGFINMQPAELLKIAVILVTAAFASKFARFMDNWKIYVVGISFTVLSCILTMVITDDLGTTIIIFAMGIVMMLVVSPKIRYILITVAFAAAGVVGIILLKPNKMVRFEAWRNLEQYSDDIGYQITQALYAIGSGGIFGKGLGKSTQKMGFVPESQNDMIFSIICEELGIIGGILLIVLVVLLIWRMKKVYDNTNDIFGKIVVAGVSTHIAVQTFVNIGVVTNLLPNTGVPLPFISYGGTAVAFLLIEVGMVLAVGRAKEEDPEKKRQEYYQRDKERGVIYFQ